MFSIRFWTFLEEVLILQVYNYHEIADNVIDKLKILVIGILLKIFLLDCLAQQLTPFFYKHKGYKHIEAQITPKIKHITSISLPWTKFLSIPFEAQNPISVSISRTLILFCNEFNLFWPNLTTKGLRIKGHVFTSSS